MIRKIIQIEEEKYAVDTLHSRLRGKCEEL